MAGSSRKSAVPTSRLNQWANVVRREMRPRIFLRTSEFLWQEGHTAHATSGEAGAFARRIHLDVYRDFLENVLAIPVSVGVKTEREKFAGAVTTMTCEAMMGDGKALQMATGHELDQNFAGAFGISFTDPAGRSRTCWTTSWGASTQWSGVTSIGSSLSLPNLRLRQSGSCSMRSTARCAARRGSGSLGARQT